MSDISKITVNGTTYDIKDARLPAYTNTQATFLRDDGTWSTAGGDAPVENGTGVGSVQSKQFVFDHDDDGEESTFVQAATGDASFAVGAGTTASGMYSHAEGLFTTAYGNRSHAEGDTTVARGNNSHVEGEYTIARGDNQHVSGKYNIEDMDEEYAEIVGNGESTSARSNARTLDWDGNAWYAGVVSSNAYPNDIVSDDDALTTTEAVHQILDEEVPVEAGTERNGTTTYPGAVQTKAFTSGGHTYHQYAMAMGAASFGLECYADSEGAFAEGSGTEASGLYSHAEGQGSMAGGQQSHAEGHGTAADGTSAHAEGYGSVASGNISHAEGNNSLSSDWYAHSEGAETAASGQASHAEGKYTIASALGAHVEGTCLQTTIMVSAEPSGNNVSVAALNGAEVGYYVRSGRYIARIEAVDTTNNTITLSDVSGISTNMSLDLIRNVASGIASHSEGYGTVASAEYAHAEGSHTKATAGASHAEGQKTIAASPNQHVEGKYNIADNNSTYAHIVGNGTGTTRSNAHTLDWSGNGWFAGNITANGGSITLHDSTGDVTITAAQLRSLLALL